MGTQTHISVLSFLSQFTGVMTKFYDYSVFQVFKLILNHLPCYLGGFKISTKHLKRSSLAGCRGWGPNLKIDPSPIFQMSHQPPPSKSWGFKINTKCLKSHFLAGYRGWGLNLKFDPPQYFK